jgi:hypothetical protein
LHLITLAAFVFGKCLKDVDTVVCAHGFFLLCLKRGRRGFPPSGGPMSC